MIKLLSTVFLFSTLCIAGCGGGEDNSPSPKQVGYSGTTLVVNSVSFTVDPGDFVADRGRIYVFTTTDASAQAELSRFVESFGLTTGQFQVVGRQPPFSAYAPVAVPGGFESQWAQALRNTPPGVSALTRVPCC
jgi:hypothetical protein